MSLLVVKAGPLATVQDLGRPGLQCHGIAPCGAMDPWALRGANLLLGNPPGAAGVELTLGGLVLRAEREVRVAVSGAAAPLRLAGTDAPTWTTLQLRAGDELALGAPSAGVWSYVAVQGGIDTPPLHGSRSTNLFSRMGGVEGRRLRGGDVLPVAAAAAGPARRVPPALLPSYPAHVEVRAIPGPDSERFAAAAYAALWSTPFTLTPAADRTGYRLRGAPLAPLGAADIASDAVAPGTVQVPGSGDPIVLLADCQTTGGYPRIATVIAADLHLVSQTRVGHQLSFREVDVGSAHAALRARQQELDDRLAAARSS